MNTLTTINDIQVSVVNYKSTPVISTEMLAKFYCADIKNIQNNFARNRGRFIENKHYFKLEGDDLKVFKHLQFSDQDEKGQTLLKMVSPKAKSLILWTERGAARHAKMLETDQAWEVFEKLEDHYFNHGEKSELPNKEYNLELLETELAYRVIKYHNELNQEIVRLGGKMPENYPNFDRETICKAYMTHFLHNTRIRMILDCDAIPKLDLIPKDSYVVNEKNIVDIIGNHGGISRELIPDIVQAGLKRLIK